MRKTGVGHFSPIAQMLALPLSLESHLISTHHSPHLNHPKPEKFPPTPAADVSHNCSHFPPSCLGTSSWRFFPGPLKRSSLTED